MVSINATTTNSFVLSSLRQTNSELSTTQNRIASGLKVASARDNASVWSTAQTIRKDLTASDSVKSGIAIAKGQADAAYEALTSMADIITKMQTASSGLVAGGATGNVAKSASIQGVNLVTGTGGTSNTTIGQDQSGAIQLSFTSTQILSANGSAGSLTGSAYASVIANTPFDGTASDATAAITAFTGALTSGLAAVNAYAARVASFSDTLGVQQDFNNKIDDIRNTALSALVDADMEKESAKVSALQVKQQLAFQALSIGNNSTQNILRLFQ